MTLGWNLELFFGFFLDRPTGAGTVATKYPPTPTLFS